MHTVQQDATGWSVICDGFALFIGLSYGAAVTLAEKFNELRGNRIEWRR